eukprot:TRINITY_DN4382_c0_g1_i3.p1 TRINITY_DN4382_c0_g1~~TRINITY_DN4382_c0_g1_i3.p1  ORF type:complete len:143 (-),score=21.12 TRINITY_DN4382_c0_g1_i3:13-441(-)
MPYVPSVAVPGSAGPAMTAPLTTPPTLLHVRPPVAVDVALPSSSEVTPRVPLCPLPAVRAVDPTGRLRAALVMLLQGGPLSALLAPQQHSAAVAELLQRCHDVPALKLFRERGATPLADLITSLNPPRQIMSNSSTNELPQQ